MSDSGNGDARHGGGLLDNNRLLTAVAALSYGLGMWWLQNTWNAIKDETKAREALAISIGQTYITKDAITLIIAGHQDQVDAITARIDRNTDRIINLEKYTSDLHDQMSDLNADHAALRALVDQIIRAEAKEHPELGAPPAPSPTQRLKRGR